MSLWIAGLINRAHKCRYVRVRSRVPLWLLEFNPDEVNHSRPDVLNRMRGSWRPEGDTGRQFNGVAVTLVV